MRAQNPSVRESTDSAYRRLSAFNFPFSLVDMREISCIDIEIPAMRVPHPYYRGSDLVLTLWILLKIQMLLIKNQITCRNILITKLLSIQSNRN